MIQVAVNYSVEAGELRREGRIGVDRFKCPAWPDLVASVGKEFPLYVHLPLRVGAGIGDALDTEKEQPADWHKLEALMARTGTPVVNLHLAPHAGDYDGLPADSTRPEHVERVIEGVLRDVRAVVERFGAKCVLVENCFGTRGRILRAGCLPEVIRLVVEETGCGFLLDLSHARLAAREQGVDEGDYFAGLPVERIAEIHVTGIRRIKGRLLEAARRAGIDAEVLQGYIGEEVDHLPLTGGDWTFASWALEQVHAGRWGRPWVVTMEYGGVGGVYELVTDKRALAKQVPRLERLVRGDAVHSTGVWS